MPTADSNVRLNIQTRGAAQAVAGLNSIRGAAKAAAGALGLISSALVLRNALSLLRNFELEMAKVRAVSGATEKEFAALENTAKRLGATTIFTATQAAEGLLLLSRAGFNASQSIEALPKVLQLAQAQSIDLGRASDIVAQTLGGAGLAASEAGRAVDVLSKAANVSNQTVSDLNESFKAVLPVLTDLGVSLETSGAVISVLANSAVRGSRAGTSLRQLFLTLLRPTTRATEALTAAGISLDDLKEKLRADDLQGFFTELQKLEGTFGRLPEVFQARTITSASILTRGELPEELARIRDALQGAAGEAQKMADIMNDTLNGAILSMNSAWQGSQLRLSFLIPAFVNILNVLGGVVSGIGETRDEFIRVNKVGIISQKIITGLSAALKAATGAAVAFTGALAVKGILAAAVAFRSLAAAVVALRFSFFGVTTVALAFIGILHEFFPRVQATVRVLYELATLQTNLTDIGKRFNEILKENNKTLKDDTPIALKETAAAAGAASSQIQKLSEDVKDLISALRIEGLSGIADELRKGLISPEDATAVLQASTAYQSAGKTINRQITNLNKALESNQKSFKQARAEMQGAEKDLEAINSYLPQIDLNLLKLNENFESGAISAREYARGLNEITADIQRQSEQIDLLSQKRQEAAIAAEADIQRQVDAAQRYIDALKKVFDLISEIQTLSDKRQQVASDLQGIQEQRAQLEQARAEEAAKANPDRGALATYDTKIGDLVREQNRLIYQQQTELSTIRQLRDGFSELLNIGSSFAGAALSKKQVDRLSQSVSGRLALSQLGRSPRRFQAGGIIPGPLGKPIPVIAHGGESIFNPRQIDKLAGLFYQQNKSLERRGSYSGPQRVNMQIVNQSSQPISGRVSRAEASYDGSLTMNMVIKDIVKSEIANGGADGAINERYGILGGAYGN